MMAEGLKTKILRSIFSVYKKKQVNAIVLFGSRARKDYRKNSDYDIIVFINGREKKSRIDFDEEINITFLNKKDSDYHYKKGHPFLFCSFRDGIVLYQKDSLFDKTKTKVLKLKPSREIIFNYLRSSFESITHIKERIADIKLCSLYIEDGKVAANKLGFALIMQHGKYPLSPHTLKQEIMLLGKGYKKIANTIRYLQNCYCLNRNFKQKFYKKNIYFFHNFLKNHLYKNFPDKKEEINKSLYLEKIFRKVKKSKI